MRVTRSSSLLALALVAGSRATASADDAALVLPSRGVAAYVDLDDVRRTTTVGGLDSVNSGLAIVAGAAFGITDDLEAGLEYGHAAAAALQTDRDSLRAHVSFAWLHTDALALGSSLELAVASSFAARLGVGLRYHVASHLDLFAGGAHDDLGATATGRGPMASRALGQQLAIGLASHAPISLDVPVGVSTTPTPRLYIGLATTLAHVGLHDDTTTLIGRDTIPIDLAVQVAATRGLHFGLYIDYPYVRDAAAEVLIAGLSATYTR